MCLKHVPHSYHASSVLAKKPLDSNLHLPARCTYLIDPAKVRFSMLKTVSELPPNMFLLVFLILTAWFNLDSALSFYLHVHSTKMSKMFLKSIPAAHSLFPWFPSSGETCSGVKWPSLQYRQYSLDLGWILATILFSWLSLNNLPNIIVSHFFFLNYGMGTDRNYLLGLLY